MTDGSLRPDAWQPVRDELDRWQSEGRIARFWLRDDDAIAATPALTRLLDLGADHGVAPMIAAIPLAVEPSLVAALARAPRARIAMHGLIHANCAHPPAKTAELVVERGRELTITALHAARARVSDLFGPDLLDCYVPPWNRLPPEVAAWLPAAGFSSVSTFGVPRYGLSGLVEANTHVDIIDWKGGRVGRSPTWVAAELARELARSRAGSGHAIGILAHHLVHDEQAWSVLAALMQATRAHRAVTWIDAPQAIE